MDPRAWNRQHYNAADAGYSVGDRVQIHPRFDRWMMGDRFGTVERVGRRYLSVRMDRSGSLSMYLPRDVEAAW